MHRSAAPTRREAGAPARTVVGMFDDDDDDVYGGARGSFSSGPAHEPLTLTLLKAVLAAVLSRHGFPPLRGYALAELTASLYRLQLPLIQ
ncbi:MAG: hypothetical protein NVSMB55_26890 [Mycobacteriales bacterium]